MNKQNIPNKPPKCTGGNLSKLCPITDFLPKKDRGEITNNEPTLRQVLQDSRLSKRAAFGGFYLSICVFCRGESGANSIQHKNICVCEKCFLEITNKFSDLSKNQNENSAETN